METKFMHFAGIDVSKHKLDVCLIVNSERTQMQYGCFEQSLQGYKSMKKWFTQLTAEKSLNSLLVLVENTGLYDDALLAWLWETKIAVCLENASNIKRSVRDNRSKMTNWTAAILPFICYSIFMNWSYGKSPEMW